MLHGDPLKNYILGILIAVVVLIAGGFLFIHFRRKPKEPGQDTSVIRGSVEHLPLLKAKKGQWAIISQKGTAIYYEIKKVSENKIVCESYLENQPREEIADVVIDLAHVTERYIAFQNDAEDERLTRHHSCIKVFEDGSEMAVKCECTRFVRKSGKNFKINWVCGGVPVTEGHVYSGTQYSHGPFYVFRSLMYFGDKPPDRDSRKFKGWMKKAREWEPEEEREKN